MAFETDPPRILTAAEIILAPDIEERTVFVPQWNGSVRIRTFSKKQADEMRRRATKRDRNTGKEDLDQTILEALLFTEGIIDPHFELEDYEKLEEKSAVAISNVLKAIMDASGLSDASVTEATKSPAPELNGALRVPPGEGTRDDTGGTLATDVGL